MRYLIALLVICFSCMSSSSPISPASSSSINEERVPVIINYAAIPPDGEAKLCTIYEEGRIIYLFLANGTDTVYVKDKSKLSAQLKIKFYPGIVTMDVIAKPWLFWIIK